jgi:hypothetical protein|nr:MAG: DNA pilot protein [Microviridae sp.]
MEYATIIGAIVAAIGSVVASVIGYNSSQKNRETEINLANTAHQREVVDLRGAGLNPILSATGGRGAITPSFETFTPENPMKGFGETMSNYSLKKQQVEESKASMPQKVAQTKALDQEVKTQIQQEGVYSAQKHAMDTQSDLNDALKVKARAETGVQSALYQKLDLENTQETLKLPQQVRENRMREGTRGNVLWWIDYVTGKIPGVSPVIAPALRSPTQIDSRRINNYNNR